MPYYPAANQRGLGSSDINNYFVAAANALDGNRVDGRLATLGLALSVASSANADSHVYFGTYTNGAGKGIYRARLESASGRLSELQLAVEARDPAFLAVHPNGKFLGLE